MYRNYDSYIVIVYYRLGTLFWKSLMERNELIKRTLLDAFAKFGDRVDCIDLWVVIDMAPDVTKIKLMPAGNNFKTMAIGLGPITRTQRLSFNSKGLKLTTKECVTENCMPINIPFDAIYCLVTDGIFAEELNWKREESTVSDKAFVNFEAPFHNIS